MSDEVKATSENDLETAKANNYTFKEFKKKLKPL